MEATERSSEVVAPLAATPRLVLWIDAGARIRAAAGASFGGMPEPETLIGVDARALLAGFRVLSQALESALAGEATVDVEHWGPHIISVRGLPAPLEGAAGALIIILDAAPLAAWMRMYESQLRTFMERTPASIWITDSELRLSHNTGPVLQPIGQDTDALVGRTLPELLGTDDPQHPAIAYHRATLDGEPTQFRYQAQGRTYTVYLEPWRGIGDRVRGCVGLSLDITESLGRQERLEASERSLAEAQRLAHLGSWEWLIAEDRVEWSEELHRVYGLAPGTFEGTYQAFLGRVHPDDRARTEHVILRALRTGEPFDYDHRILRADGVVRTLWTTGEVKRDGAGTPSSLLGSCLDVTDLTRMSHESDHAASLLRATLESTQDGILVIGADRRVTVYNQRFLELWGISHESIAAGDDEELLENVMPLLEDPQAFTARVRELYEEPELESFDVIVFKDGRVFERYSRPQRISGEVVGRVWSFRDISERNRLYSRAVFLADASRLLASLDVEEALKALAHLIVPFLGDACAVDLFVDEGGPRRLLAVSADPAGALLEEVPRAAMAGRSLAYEVANRSCLAVPLHGRDTLLGVLTIVGAAGRRYDDKDLELAQELGRRVALAFDNARLYRRAEEMLKMRDEFLSIAAHELRGPATSLSLGVQSLRSGKLPPGAVPKTLDLCARQVRQIARFIDELLDVGRIRAGRLHFDLTEVDLAVIVREVAARMTPEVSRSGSELTVSTSGNVVGFWDPMRLDQVISNLLSNAIKFGQGKPIEIEVRGPDNIARLSVRDHGIGVPPDRRVDIFQPFERAVSPRRYGGLGLGLYICRTIVEGFGGAIRVESQLEEGSTFIVELPRSQRPL